MLYYKCSRNCSISHLFLLAFSLQFLTSIFGGLCAICLLIMLHDISHCEFITLSIFNSSSGGHSPTNNADILCYMYKNYICLFLDWCVFLLIDTQERNCWSTTHAIFLFRIHVPVYSSTNSM